MLGINSIQNYHEDFKSFISISKKKNPVKLANLSPNFMFLK